MKQEDEKGNERPKRVGARMGDRCARAFERTHGYAERLLTESSPRPGVTRIADEHRGIWVDYDTSGWRIRRIAAGNVAHPPRRPDGSGGSPDRDLAATAAKLTVNAAITLRDRTRTDDGFDAPRPGTGRPTPLAAYGVFRTLRNAGCATQVADAAGTPSSWRITPLGRRTQAFVRANWDSLNLRDPR